MLCGPDQIVGCPHCSKPARQPTIRMGNPVGVRVWTDGKQISPMEFEAPVVAICLGCDHPFWLASAKILGEIDSLKGEEGVVDLDPLWLEAEHLEEPSEEEYHRAIAVGLATNPIRNGRYASLLGGGRTTPFEKRPQPVHPIRRQVQGGRIWRLCPFFWEKRRLANA